MGDNRTLKKIGGRLREESRGLVEAKLPERLRVLVDQLACLEKRRDHEASRVRSDAGLFATEFRSELHVIG
jgi:hypothetical protein